jgi:glycerophosphoryl diester phosphodiesterase
MYAPPLLLGHRGTRVARTVLENSLAAFDNALAEGCDGFEFDVRASADGASVIAHDAKVGGVMIAKSKQSRLRNLPQLGEVLREYGPRGFLDIELKVDGLEPSVLRLLREHPPVRGYVVSSFLPSVVLELRARRGALPLGIICDTRPQVRRGLELPVDYMILEQALVEEDLVRVIHGLGRRLLVWTVNKPETMRHLARWRVDGIISDDPALLVRTLSAKTAKAEMPPAKRAKRASVKIVKKARGRGKN